MPRAKSCGSVRPRGGTSFPYGGSLKRNVSPVPRVPKNMSSLPPFTGMARSREEDAPSGVFLFSWLETPVGSLVAGATEEGIGLLEFSDPRRLETQLSSVRRLFPARRSWNQPAPLPAGYELAEYFAGERRSFWFRADLPGDTLPTPGLGVAPGDSLWPMRSYEDLAVALGQPKAVRAVGHANGRNRIAIVIPCHRVIAKGGGLGGYGGGLRRKQDLLDLEQGRRRLW